MHYATVKLCHDSGAYSDVERRETAPMQPLSSNPSKLQCGRKPVVNASDQ
ncbi:hypothetical protein RP20_CCG017142 [Aedes albopictus]|nr:hypothetical protein RP20_CCG017142 [Aedes albopictus]